MKSATQLSRADLAILLVGDPGMRKTTLALRFPRPYFFDADANLAAPMEFLNRNGEVKREDVYYNRADVNDDGKPVAPRMRYLHMVECINRAAASDKVDTIVLDSLTAISDIIIEECKRQASLGENAPMRVQDWGTFGKTLKRLVEILRATGKIIVFTAHNKVELDEADKRYKYFINVPGQAASYLSGLFTDVLNPFVIVTQGPSGPVHTWRIRCLPASDADHRGVKSSFGFKAIEPYENVIKAVENLEKILKAERGQIAPKP